ncbi:BA14K family protein [Mesorhizobium waimense]|uniref:Lectin-like protein BA14k n=1 Tax=Mesorhizobium waimense TaxID=1300307 RepID=A0A3A5JYQ7_9HYPH|nr:BA14K family protein [Mesorhizobium waimense]
MGIVGGFVLTLSVFASGLAFAVWLLAAKPVRQITPSIGVAELWTKDAHPVNKEAQTLERIPAEQAAVPDAKADAAAAPQTTPATTDAIATSAIQPSTDEELASAVLPAAHVEWCMSRYRSYRPGDNSYMSYSGQQRPCISPYLDPGTPRRAAQPADAASYVEANDASMDGYATTYEADGAQLSPDHMEYCFSRYRSYRPEDNTYQPYSGGPRQQCE